MFPRQNVSALNSFIVFILDDIKKATKRFLAKQNWIVVVKLKETHGKFQLSGKQYVAVLQQF